MANQWDNPYSQEYDSKVVPLFQRGYSITRVANSIGIARSTYYKWKDEHASFRAACEFGEEAAEVYHEIKLEAGADGEIENYNAPSRIFIMKSRFRKTYGEQKEEKSAGDTLLEQLVLGKVKITSTE